MSSELPFFYVPSSFFLNQGSRDNMSVVLVCFPNAPKVSEEAVKREAELDKFLEAHVEGKSSTCSFVSQFSALYIQCGGNGHLVIQKVLIPDLSVSHGV